MEFQSELREGRFLQRYKRFFADVDLDGQVITCHVPNTGSLKGCLSPAAPCLFSTSQDPKRKLPHTLQMIRASSTWVGVNTSLANDLVWEAWTHQKISNWQEFAGAQREVKISPSSRVDLVLWQTTDRFTPDTKISLKDFEQHKFHFVEVKNVTLAETGQAQFPDAVTERGQKHLIELMRLKSEGHGAEIVFVVQREDCHSFAPARAIDPRYADLLHQAHEMGVVVRAYGCELKKEGVWLNPKPLKLEI